MKLILAIAASLLLCIDAQAQLRKCTGPDGKVTYSDVACATTAQTDQALVVTKTDGLGVTQYEQAHGRPQNAYERELSGKIAGYLARNDFEHAATIAVTPEHFKMIADAKRERQSVDAEKLAAKRAARPTVCASSGRTNGSVTNLPRGWTNSFNSNSSSVTVCNK